MLTIHISGLIARELSALRREIERYPDDASLWRTPPGIANSAGTLALHLCGNLRHYIGARLGEDGYVRDRPAEFARRGVSREALTAEIDATAAAVAAVLPRLDPSRLGEPYPESVGGVIVRTDEFLVHLVTHLAYHLGQVDYHRRLVLEDPHTVGAIRLTSLSTAIPA